jgi:hypothetical protein
VTSSADPVEVAVSLTVNAGVIEEEEPCKLLLGE